MSRSDPNPWDADRELTCAQAAAAIAQAVPELAGRDVRLLGSGWDFDAYEVAGEWVFKFARRAKEVERLRYEMAVLALIDGRVDLPVPRYAWPALEAASFPYAFSGYRKLEGSALDAFPPASARIAAIAPPLARFLEQLHAIPVAEAAFLQGRGEGALAPAAWRGRYERGLCSVERLAPASLWSRLCRWWDDPSVVPAAYTGPPRLRHADLHPGHVLLDADDGLSVQGVIDWGDVELGDPAAEFSGFVSWGGLAALDACLAPYGAADEGLRARARFGGMICCVVDIDYAHRTSKPAAARRSLAVLDGLL